MLIRPKFFVLTLLFACVNGWTQNLETRHQDQGSQNPQLQWSRGLSPLLKPVKTLQSFEGEPGVMTLKKEIHSAPLTALADTLRKDIEPRSWSILMCDKTLYRSMRRWAQDANYQLLCQIDRDYPIEASVIFENNLKGAVEQVMAAVALTDYPIQALMNPNARIIRVVRYMDDERR